MTWRIGIVGAGAVASLHARAIDHNQDTTLVAVCDLDRDRAAALKAGVMAFTDYGDLLDSVELDVMIINTPHALHLPMTMAAIERGLHVLVEKPLAISVSECTTLIDAAALRGVVLGVGQVQHFLPEKRTAYDLVESGAIGRVLAIHDQRTTDYRPGHRAPWFFDPAMAGGGAVMNIGGHCLDRCLWLAGSKATSVRASMLRRFGSPVETDGHLEVTLASGIRANIALCSDQPQPLDQVTVIGELGSVSAIAKQGTWLRRDGLTEEIHRTGPQDIPQAFLDQWDDFVTAVRGGLDSATLSVDPRHARHIVEIIHAAYEAEVGGGEVPIGAPSGALDGTPSGRGQR